MLSSIARFGSSKGMVAVPNFLSSSNASAISQTLSLGLIVSTLSAETPTNVSSKGGMVLSQSPAPGTLVDYETPIIINYGKFFADSINIGNCEGYPGSTTSTGNRCVDGQTLTYFSVTTTKRRKKITVTNNSVVPPEVTISYDYDCLDDVSGGGSGYVNGSCGYVTPPSSCTKTTNYTAYSACNAAYQVYSSGTQTRTVSGTGTDCQPYSYPESRTCYQAVCGPYGSWGNHPDSVFKQQRVRLCQNTDGSRYFDYDDRCRTSQSVTYGTCNTKTNKKVQTTKNYSCGVLQSTTTASIPCNAQ
jgi:hypothetical protein